MNRVQPRIDVSQSTYAQAYLSRMNGIPHRAEGDATLLSEVPPQSKRVLDLGCGNGHLLALALSHCPDATGVGLDFSPTMWTDTGSGENLPCSPGEGRVPNRMGLAMPLRLTATQRNARRDGANYHGVMQLNF